MYYYQLILYKIVNLSLEQGVLPGGMKEALLRPLLKQSLDMNYFQITGLYPWSVVFLKAPFWSYVVRTLHHTTPHHTTW